MTDYPKALAAAREARDAYARLRNAPDSSYLHPVRLNTAAAKSAAALDNLIAALDAQVPLLTVCLRGERYGHDHMQEIQVQVEPGVEIPQGAKLYLAPVAPAAAVPVVGWRDSSGVLHNDKPAAEWNPRPLTYADVPAAAVPSRETLLGAVARGWTHETTKHLEVDATLATAIADEVAKLMHAPPPAGLAVVPEVTEGMVDAAAKAFWDFLDIHGASTGADGYAMREALAAALAERNKEGGE